MNQPDGPTPLPDGKPAGPSEQESLAVAEASREVVTLPSFLRELFLGNFRLDLLYPLAEAGEESPEFKEFYARLKEFLRDEVDPDRIDVEQEYPPEVIEGLRRLGAFGMKVPKEYGGLGLRQFEYDKAIRLLGSRDASVLALLSAHQSIGVPTPLKMFGTPEQKKKYLSRCAAGAITAFALTEPDVGSDPARLSTTVTLSEDGRHYLLNGEKLWCTNGTFAELMVVMAAHAGSRKISAFIVENAWEGVEVVGRCRFMGIRAIGNALIRFRNVKVPKENLLYQEGKGLKLALVTLNTGRLALPAGAVGTVKYCLEVVRRWANQRVQWGQAIGRHEAIAHKITSMAAHIFAMEAMSAISDRLADLGNYDIRLEAAAAKEWNTARGWQILDDTMQIRGGRGYETESSLRERGEEPIGIERMMRDFRINLIFEGSSEIMHLFMAREAVDRHLEVAGDLIDPKKGLLAKLMALPRIGLFYAWWYPTRWLGWGLWPRFWDFGTLGRHLRFVERSARKLARQVFHGMVRFGPRLQHKQAFLFRVVDIGLELFAMASSVARARSMADESSDDAVRAAHLADVFCRLSRHKVRKLFGDLWSNDDDLNYRTARQILDGEHVWLEEGTVTHGAAPSPERIASEGVKEAETAGAATR